MNKKRKVTEHMKDWIILDNGLTMSLFANPNLMEKIRTSKNSWSYTPIQGVKETR